MAVSIFNCTAAKSPLGDLGEKNKKVIMERQMFYGAKKEIFEKAKTLRENMTDAEKIL